jgi:hypothetical protein
LRGTNFSQISDPGQSLNVAIESIAMGNQIAAHRCMPGLDFEAENRESSSTE